MTNATKKASQSQVLMSYQQKPRKTTIGGMLESGIFTSFVIQASGYGTAYTRYAAFSNATGNLDKKESFTA